MRAMRRLTLSFASVALLVGCGGSVKTVTAPASSQAAAPSAAAVQQSGFQTCTLYLEGSNAQFTVSGTGADSVCADYVQKGAAAGQLWTRNVPASISADLKTVCQLASSSGNGMLTVEDTASSPGSLLPSSDGQHVCEAFLAGGAWTEQPASTNASTASSSLAINCDVDVNGAITDHCKYVSGPAGAAGTPTHRPSGVNMETGCRWHDLGRDAAGTGAEVYVCR